MASNLTSNDIESEHVFGWKERKIISEFTGDEQSSPPKMVKQQFKCDLCGSTHVSKNDMQRHLDNHVIQTLFVFEKMDIPSKNSQKKYRCDICSTKFNKLGSVRTHINIHINERPYKCDVCTARFNRASYLKKHACLSVKLG